jgi:heme/copper-type cytochrome/quinol oxidase subunit 3
VGLRAFLIWLALLVVAVLNGGFREGVLAPRVGASTAHVVSSIMLATAILLVSYVAMPWIRPATTSDAIAIGLGWLALTLAFEFGFGRARGRSWQELRVDYDLLKGRIWVLVLIATAAAPYVAARARGLLGGSTQ